MFFEPISLLAAAVACVAIGFVWYHPSVFGTMWTRAAGITPEMAERGKKNMPLMAIGGFLASIAVAYVMTYFALVVGVFDWIGALELAFWCWAGFAAPILLGPVLWEQKPLQLFVINALYWLAALSAVAVIVTW